MSCFMVLFGVSALFPTRGILVLFGWGCLLLPGLVSLHVGWYAYGSALWGGLRFMVLFPQWPFGLCCSGSMLFVLLLWTAFLGAGCREVFLVACCCGVRAGVQLFLGSLCALFGL